MRRPARMRASGTVPCISIASFAKQSLLWLEISSGRGQLCGGNDEAEYAEGYWARKGD